MICLNKRQILFLHEELIRETGGSPGPQDEALSYRAEGCHSGGSLSVC